MNALDAYLAAKLFGIDTAPREKHDWDGDYHDLGEYCGGPQCKHCRDYWRECCDDEEPEGPCQKYIPNYSGNLSVCWRAVTKFRELGYDTSYIDDDAIDGWNPLGWTEAEFAERICEAMRDYLMERNLNK